MLHPLDPLLRNLLLDPPVAPHLVLRLDPLRDQHLDQLPDQLLDLLVDLLLDLPVDLPQDLRLYLLRGPLLDLLLDPQRLAQL